MYQPTKDLIMNENKIITLKKVLLNKYITTGDKKALLMLKFLNLQQRKLINSELSK